MAFGIGIRGRCGTKMERYDCASVAWRTEAIDVHTERLLDCVDGDIVVDRGRSGRGEVSERTFLESVARGSDSCRYAVSTACVTTVCTGGI